MVQMHVLFNAQCESRCKAAYRLSVVFRSVQTVRIKRRSNPWGTNSVSEPHVYLRMRREELRCSVVDHVMWQRSSNGGDDADGGTGEATEAGEVPRGFGEQRPGAEGDVQRRGALGLPGFRLYEQL